MMTRDSKIKYYFAFTPTDLFSSTQALFSILLTPIKVVLSLEDMEEVYLSPAGALSRSDKTSSRVRAFMTVFRYSLLDS